MSGLIVRLPRRNDGGARDDASGLIVRLARRRRGGGRERQQPADNTRLGAKRLSGGRLEMVRSWEAGAEIA